MPKSHGMVQTVSMPSLRYHMGTGVTVEPSKINLRVGLHVERKSLTSSNALESQATSIIFTQLTFLIVPNYRNLIDSLVPLFNRTTVDLKAPGYVNQRLHLAEMTRDPVIDRDPGRFRPPEQRAYKTWINERGSYHDYIFTDREREFWNSGSQRVLQMRVINLVANNPNYKGEDWHVQGQNVSQTPGKETSSN